MASFEVKVSNFGRLELFISLLFGVTSFLMSSIYFLCVFPTQSVNDKSKYIKIALLRFVLLWFGFGKHSL